MRSGVGGGDSNVNRITVHVIQARNLPVQDAGPHAKADPYTKVMFGGFDGVEYQTKCIRNKLNPVWNATFQEEAKGLFKRVSYIQFDVYDYDALSKDERIGGCKLDINPVSDSVLPVQWLDLLNEKGEPLKGKNGEIAALQISLRYELNTQDLSIRSWTDVLQITIKKAKNKGPMAAEEYVAVEFGAQCFQTKTVKNTDQEPTWNQSSFFFVNDQNSNDSQIKLSVLAKDIKANDNLGTGYLSMDEVFAKCKGGETLQSVVKLKSIPVTSDRGLTKFDPAEESDEVEVWGSLEVELKLTSREKVEEGFFAALVKMLDANKDGIIDRDEAEGMFAALGLNFDALDQDHDMKLNEEEVIRALNDVGVQQSDMIMQCMALYLHGDMGDDWQKHLMTGVTLKPGANSKTLKIRDRATGLVVQEFIPQYVQWALKLLYDNKVNRKMVKSKAVISVLTKASAKKGVGMDSEKSAGDIAAFVKQHSLNTKTLAKPLSEYKTFNDFFARGLKVDECRPLADPEDESVIVSPADCRMMVWDTIFDSTTVWIKGASFTLENLLGPNTKVDLKKYEGGSFAIARLAPQDYHRFHYPIGGKVINIEHIDGALYTVNPIAINREVDVYTENKRAIIEIDGGKNGGCVMFAIAATMVGSYTLFRTEAEDPTTQQPIPLEEGDEVKRGDVAGEFRFGGSTVLMLFEPNRVKWSEDIQRNVQVKFETLLQVRTRIGQIVSVEEEQKPEEEAKEEPAEEPADEKPADEKPADDKPAEEEAVEEQAKEE